MCYHKKISFIIFFSFYSFSVNAENHLNKFLIKWPNCNLDNYELSSKKGTETKGQEIFIINGKQKKVNVRQIRYNLKSKNLDLSENKVCPYFSFIETFYKKERLFTISTLSTTLSSTKPSKVPHIPVIEKHTYFENYANYLQAELDGLVDDGIASQYMVFNIGKKKILQINKIKVSNDDVEFPYLYVKFKTKSKKILSSRSDINLIENNQVKELLTKKFSAFDNIMNNKKDLLFSKSDFDLLEDNLDEIGYVRYQTRD